MKFASTRGDFALRFDGTAPADDLANGILMVSLRENGRSNQGSGIGTGLGYATPAIQTPATLGALVFAGYTTSINIGNSAISGVTSGGEWNTNQSFAYFKYSGWLGGSGDRRSFRTWSASKSADISMAGCARRTSDGCSTAILERFGCSTPFR